MNDSVMACDAGKDIDPMEEMEFIAQVKESTYQIECGNARNVPGLRGTPQI